MQGAYSPKDVVIKVGTSDRMTGEVLSEKEVVGFAEKSLTYPALDSFVNTVKELGIGYLFGLVRGVDETGEEFEQRIMDVKKGRI